MAGQDGGILELLIKAGAPVNVRNQYGRTPLFVAVNRRNPALVERLLQAGADINVKDKLGGDTPFLSSIGKRKVDQEMMRLLARRGADVTAIDDYGRSALGIASRYLGRNDFATEEDLQLVDGLRKTFIEIGVLQPDGNRFTAAASAGDLSAVGKFIESGMPLDTVDEEERTALYMAVSRRHPELVAFLLKTGANVHKPAGTDSDEDKHWGGIDLPCPRCGEVFTAITGIRRCPKCGHEFKPQEILGQNHDAELFMTWSNGHLPVVTAARLGDSQILEMLLNAGADPNRGLQKITPLMYACYFGHLDAARTLIAHGAEVTQEGKTPDRVAEKVTAIGYAAKRQHIELVKLLWDSGVPAVNKNSTLLVDAARKNDAQSIKRLLSEGADVNLADPLIGERPLDIASQNGNAEAATALMAAGAIVNPSPREFPPLWQALNGIMKLGSRKLMTPETVERYVRLINSLLAAGARPDVSVYGTTPISMAEQIKCDPIVELLKAAVEKARPGGNK